jgi:2-oxoglutarate dehydrogenase E2 component (dihydrolipoamide succinyltransferase)
MPFLINFIQFNYHTMIIEIKIPSPGESVTEVEIGKWLVENGALVSKDQEIAEIESDKATLSLTAPATGRLYIQTKEGEKVTVGKIVCTLDTDDLSKSTGIFSGQIIERNTFIPDDIKSKELLISAPDATENENISSGPKDKIKLTPAARAVMEGAGLNINEILNGLRRISLKEVEAVLKLPKDELSLPDVEHTRSEERLTMTPLRRKLSQRLVAVKNETAMLTTFNEIDMNQLIELRNKYQQPFSDKYGIKLGFMSFFAKAVSVALSKHPVINSMIDGDDIVLPRYHDIGIAVQTPKGLMVPIIRNAETKDIEAIEREIKELADKARNKKLAIQEMAGGTFTITNGGVFGSLMSTPIINPPQSAILGMHSIKNRPVAVNGKVEIRPMMYVALSYDHRIIDGSDSVMFLVTIKDLIENPATILLGGKSPEEQLLGL